MYTLHVQNYRDFGILPKSYFYRLKVLEFLVCVNEMNKCPLYFVDSLNYKVLHCYYKNDRCNIHPPHSTIINNYFSKVVCRMTINEQCILAANAYSKL